MASARRVFVTALVIAICWTSGIFTTKLLQKKCGYQKPFLLTYLHELAATAISVPFAWSPMLWPRCRSLAVKAMGMGLLAFVANISFMVALVLTTASSAMTLEQLTPVFIAGLSCLLLKERYQACQLFWLLVAIVGSVLTARSDLKAQDAGASVAQQMLGDFLVVVTCFTAGLYMVFFKMVFAEQCSGSFQMLFTYFMMKGMSVAVVGGIILLFLPKSHRGLPESECGWTYLSINMVANTCFNLSLAWGMLLVSPLACRLFVLLGLPVSLLLDSLLGVSLAFQRILGVTVVAAGVAGFEFSSPKAEDTETEEEMSSISESGVEESCSLEPAPRGASVLCALGALGLCASGFALARL